MTDSPEDLPEGFDKQRVTYLGETTAKGKRRASYRDESGTTWTVAWSAKYGQYAVGYIYEILASETSVRGEFVWTGDKAPDFEDLRMQDKVRTEARELVRLEAKARTSDPDLDALLAHVREYAGRLIKDSSRAALIQILTKAVWQARRGR